MKHFFTLLCILFSSQAFFAQSPGNALHFDGSGDYVSCPIPAVFTNLASNDFTVETWVKPGAFGTNRIFFAQQSSSVYASILLNAAGAPYIYISTGGTTIGLNTSNTLPAGQWSHLAVTWDASAGQTQMYINGVLQTLASGGSTSGGPNGLMAIGSKTDGSQNLNGALDEFRIWQDVRSACEINASMHHILNGNEAGLVHYYNFDQGTAGGANAGTTSLPDLTGTATGTLNNFALNGASSNWIASDLVITGTGETPLSGSSALSICQGDTIVFAGNPVFAGGIYTDTLSSSSGCDSVHTLTLSVNPVPTHSITASTCDFYNFNGDILSAAGVYYDTLVSAAGCDSIVQLTLTVNSVDLSVSQSGHVLTANASGATFQWLNCQTSTLLAGATSASYTATFNGQFAVLVTQNGCTDTSACFTVNTVGLNEAGIPELNVYPNPAQDFITISAQTGTLLNTVSLSDMQGRVLLQRNDLTLPAQLNIQSFPGGVYLLTLSGPAGKSTQRILKM